MTNSLRSEWILDTKQFIASAQMAGKATATEAEQMQRKLDNISRSLKDMATRGADIKKIGDAHRDAAAGAEEQGRASAGMTRELIVLGHELSQGNFKRFGGSLLVLAEYSTTAKNALSYLVGPLGLIAAAVGLVTFEIIHGAFAQDKFNKSIIATGNYAGLTADKYNALAAAAAKVTHSTIGAASDALSEVAGTGRFGPELLQSVTQAALLTARTTGQTTEEVVKDFAQMRDGVAKWAEEHNKATHFIDAGLYEHVRRLEEAGQAEKAMQLVIDAWQAHFAPVVENLGYLARAWDGLKGAISGAAHAMQEWGKDETGGQELVRLRATLAKLEAYKPGVKSGFDAFAQSEAKEIRERIVLLERLNAGKEESAKRDAERAKTQELGVSARKAGDDELAKTKSLINLKKELADWQSKFDQAAAASKPFSAEEQRAIIEQIKHKYTPRDEKKMETEINNLVKSLNDEGVKLRAETVYFQLYGKAIDSAHAAVVKFRTTQGDLKTATPAQKAMVDKAAEAADAAAQGKKAAETVAWAHKRTEALLAEASARALSAREEHIANILHDQGAQGLGKETQAYKDLADAAGKKYDATVSGPALEKWRNGMDANVQKINAEISALGMSTLVQKQAATTAKLLAEAQAEVVKYPERAKEIWESYARAVDNATDAEKRLYDAQRTEAVGIRTAIQKYVDDATNGAKFADNFLTGSFKHMEDALVSFAKTGKLSFSSLFSFMAEEFLRNQIRMMLAGSIGNLSGFSSISGIISGIGSFLGFGAAQTTLPTGDFSRMDRIPGVPGLATGMDRVPYDGFLAYLHKDERVQTASQARGATGGSGGSIMVSYGDINVGQGVSRGEVASALKIAQAQTVAAIERMHRTTGRFA